VYGSPETIRYKSQYLRYLRASLLQPVYFQRTDSITLAQYPSGRSASGVWTAGMAYTKGTEPEPEPEPYLPDFDPSSPSPGTGEAPDDWNPPQFFQWPTDDPFNLYCWWQSHGVGSVIGSRDTDYVKDSFTDVCRLASPYNYSAMVYGQSVGRSFLGRVYPPVTNVVFATGVDTSAVYYTDDQCLSPRVMTFRYSKRIPGFATWRVSVAYSGRGGGIVGTGASQTFPRFICFDIAFVRVPDSGGGFPGGGGGPDDDPPDGCQILSWDCNCPDMKESQSGYGGRFPSQQRDRSWVGSRAGVNNQGPPQWCKHLYDLAARTCSGVNYDPRDLDVRPSPPPELVAWFGAPTADDPPGGWGEWLANRRREQQAAEYAALQAGYENKWQEINEIWNDFNELSPSAKAQLYNDQRQYADEQFALGNYPATAEGLLQFRDDVQALGQPYLIDEWLRDRLELPPVEPEYSDSEENLSPNGLNPSDMNYGRESGDRYTDENGVSWEVI